MQTTDTYIKTLGLTIAICAALGISLFTTGCTFHVGIDYNGKTGVDNRTASELQHKHAAQVKY